MGAMFGRREFLAGLGATGLGVIWPLAAPAAAERVVRTLDARVVRRRLLGRDVALWLYGGRFPGPPLVLREGQTLELRFTNRLPEPTNLHFHGLRIPPTGRADNIFLEIPPGESFTYEWTAPVGEAGTYWYHPHRHGLIATQMWRGLAGGLVVLGPHELDPQSPLAQADDRLVVLRDVALAGATLAPHAPRDWHKGKEGPWLLANGRVAPVLRARSRLVRLRLVNAANARSLRLARADGRPLVLAALDGHLLAAPQEVEELLLVPAQRADLLLAMTPTERVRLIARHYNRGVPTPRLQSSRVLEILPPPADAPVVPLPRVLAGRRPQPGPVVRRRTLTLAMFTLNGRPYRPGRVDIRAQAGTVERWRLVNVGTMDHSFHLHTWFFRPVSRNGRPWPFDCRLDTVNLRPGEVVEIDIPFVRESGRTVYHCHIAEHGDRGMMGTIEVEPALPWSGPVSTDAICAFPRRR